jgi:predicted metalloprotease with PDZ domain
LLSPWLHRVRRSLPCGLVLTSALLAQAPSTQEKPPVIVLDVDAASIPRKILSARETFPIASQEAHTVDLVYPKWIPGNHSPTGPIANLVSLHFTSEGKTLAWVRDPVDMYRFHIPVPAGTHVLTAEFSVVGSYTAGDDFGLGNTSTPVQGDVNWDQILLYPADSRTDDITISASIKLPERWSYATTLPHPTAQSASLHFDPVSLTTLVDSPVMCGAYMHEFDITPKGSAQPHSLDLFEQTQEGLNVSAERIDAFRNLVSEAGAMFHAHHYTQYRFLVEAAGEASDGLEHEQSSDEQIPSLGMVNPSFSAEAGNLLAHEMIHSWNGKFRRPAGLATANYQEPMIGDLLWVYEGLTSYWAEVLGERSGLESDAQVKDRLALYQAELETRTGRDWRSLADVSRSAQLLYTADEQWTILRRSTDFYKEGPLLWLQVDSLMREKSKGKRSLDSFAADFYQPDGASGVKPYTYEELIHALNQVVPFDWNSLLQEDLKALRPTQVSPGLEAAGWKVIYNDEPNQAMADAEGVSSQADLSMSIGLILDQDGSISDVTPDSAAGRAGLAPGSKVMGINHRVYSADLLRQAIVSAETTQQPISLLTLTNGFYAEVPVPYVQGLRSPHLTRIPGKADLLSAIMKPRRNS